MDRMKTKLQEIEVFRFKGYEFEDEEERLRAERAGRDKYRVALIISRWNRMVPIPCRSPG